MAAGKHDALSTTLHSDNNTSRRADEKTIFLCFVSKIPHSIGWGLLALVSTSCFFAFILVLFSDFISLSLSVDGYASQRILLAGLSGLLVVIPVSCLVLHPVVRLMQSLILFPVLMLCLVFIMLALPFRDQ